MGAWASETERQVLGAARCVAVDKGTESDLVGDTETRQSFDDDADHEAHHGSAAIQEFNALELIPMDLLFGMVLNTLFTG
jgi:hypothetical protein